LTGWRGVVRSIEDEAGRRDGDGDSEVGWCRLTVSNSVLKVPMVSALKTIIS
jgi:hypothetical protein